MRRIEAKVEIRCRLRPPLRSSLIRAGCSSTSWPKGTCWRSGPSIRGRRKVQRVPSPIAQEDAARRDGKLAELGVTWDNPAALTQLGHSLPQSTARSKVPPDGPWKSRHIVINLGIDPTAQV